MLYDGYNPICRGFKWYCLTGNCSFDNECACNWSNSPLSHGHTENTWGSDLLCKDLINHIISEYCGWKQIGQLQFYTYVSSWWPFSFFQQIGQLQFICSLLTWAHQSVPQDTGMSINDHDQIISISKCSDVLMYLLNYCIVMSYRLVTITIIYELINLNECKCSNCIIILNNVQMVINVLNYLRHSQFLVWVGGWS